MLKFRQYLDAAEVSLVLDLTEYPHMKREVKVYRREWADGKVKDAHLIAHVWKYRIADINRRLDEGGLECFRYSSVEFEIEECGYLVRLGMKVSGHQLSAGSAGDLKWDRLTIIGEPILLSISSVE